MNKIGWGLCTCDGGSLFKPGEWGLLDKVEKYEQFSSHAPLEAFFTQVQEFIKDTPACVKIPKSFFVHSNNVKQFFVGKSASATDSKLHFSYIAHIEFESLSNVLVSFSKPDPNLDVKMFIGLNSITIGSMNSGHFVMGASTGPHSEVFARSEAEGGGYSTTSATTSAMLPFVLSVQLGPMQASSAKISKPMQVEIAGNIENSSLIEVNVGIFAFKFKGNYTIQDSTIHFVNMLETTATSGYSLSRLEFPSLVKNSAIIEEVNNQSVKSNLEMIHFKDDFINSKLTIENLEHPSVSHKLKSIRIDGRMESSQITMKTRKLPSMAQIFIAGVMKGSIIETYSPLPSLTEMSFGSLENSHLNCKRITGEGIQGDWGKFSKASEGEYKCKYGPGTFFKPSDDVVARRRRAAAPPMKGPSYSGVDSILTTVTCTQFPP